MKNFHLQIVTPDGPVYDGEAKSILVRTDDGDVQILAGHVDYMASVGTGRAQILTEKGEKNASCSGGLLTVSNGNVRLVAITFEFSEDIDLERAKAAKAKAEEMIEKAKNNKSEQEEMLARAKLLRALSRIDAFEKK